MPFAADNTKSRISVELDQKEPFLEKFVSNVQYTSFANPSNQSAHVNSSSASAQGQSMQILDSESQAASQGHYKMSQATSLGHFNQSRLTFDKADKSLAQADKNLLQQIAKLKEAKIEIESRVPVNKTKFEREEIEDVRSASNDSIPAVEPNHEATSQGKNFPSASKCPS